MEPVKNINVHSPLATTAVVEAKTSLGAIAMGVVTLATVLAYGYVHGKTQQERLETDCHLKNIAVSVTISAATAVISAIAVVVLNSLGVTALTASLPVCASVCLLSLGAGIGAYRQNSSQRVSWWSGPYRNT